MDEQERSVAPTALARSIAGDGTTRLQVMRRVAVVMFMTGGTTSALGAQITARTAEAKAVHLWAASTLVACGLILLIAPVRRRLIELLVLVAVSVLGLLIAGSDPMGMAPLFYLWPAVFTGYFCSHRRTMVVLVASGVSLAAGLAWNDTHDLKVDTFVGVTSSVGLMTVLVAAMTRRESTLREELAAMAATDPLTGLLNRRAFDRALGRLVDGADRGRSTILIVFDLDHFKQFNDRFGHLAGDVALRTFADLLRSQAGADGVVGRFGGEEFVVALSGRDVAGAAEFARAVAWRLADLPGETFHGLTVSAGIGAQRVGDTPNELFGRADRALYAAKDAGRARSAWFDGDTIVVDACCPDT